MTTPKPEGITAAQEPTDRSPAFPTQYNANDPRTDGYYTVNGMELRDYFAAQVIPIIYSEDQADYLKNARNAYAVADAMMKAREQ